MPWSSHPVEFSPSLLFCLPVNAPDRHMAYLGGFSPGVPPLPIPNREVKPGRADGTAPQCGRVGRRLLDWSLCSERCGGSFAFSPSPVPSLFSFPGPSPVPIHVRTGCDEAPLCSLSGGHTRARRCGTIRKKEILCRNRSRGVFDSSLGCSFPYPKIKNLRILYFVIIQ